MALRIAIGYQRDQVPCLSPPTSITGRWSLANANRTLMVLKRSSFSLWSGAPWSRSTVGRPSVGPARSTRLIRAVMASACSCGRALYHRSNSSVYLAAYGLRST